MSNILTTLKRDEKIIDFIILRKIGNWRNWSNLKLYLDVLEDIKTGFCQHGWYQL